MSDDVRGPLTGVGEAVNHLSEYFKHLTTIAAGAIAFLAAFGGDLLSSGYAGWFAIGALVSLGICILMSTGMMWAYGVARRKIASVAIPDSGVDWAFQASKRSIRYARIMVKYASWLAPVSFVSGFVLLAVYAGALLALPQAPP